MINFFSARALSLGAVFYLSATGASAATLTLNTNELPSDIEAKYGGAIQAQRLTGKYANCTLLYEGGVERGDLQKFHALYGYDGENYHNGLPDGATLCLSSPGGNLYESLVIVDFLREVFADLQTYVADGDMCASACSNLFLSGAHTFEGESYETIAMRAIAPTALLGVHAPRIVLPNDGETYDAEEVAAVYDEAIRDSSHLFAFAQKVDDESTPYLTPYLYARSIETPPHDMYFVDTVGDAIFANVPVTGVSYDVDLNPDLIDTICDNVFLLDDGSFSWAFAPTWKPHPLASISEIYSEFVQILELEAHEYQSEDGPFYTSSLNIEQKNGAIYGYRRGYRTGGAYWAEDCLVRLPSSAQIGAQANFGSARIAWDARDSHPIEVRIGTQHPRSDYAEPEAPHVNSPYDYWNILIQNDENQLHTYPALMLFALGRPLSDLPRITGLNTETEEAAATNDTESDTLTCDDLWFMRNRIFHNNGYCFGSQRGISTFGNDGCFTKSPSLSETDATIMNAIKQTEKDLGC
ncbi:YARHG domain-containing protein [Shimia sagamensis]|uniref:YARHG domain-containing protein n=1 Tax=Shimia sagamensis TaxID=1566352 RepID=A0ABY1PD22_9RHOB|nr:YARHG domain-containing protein [Shimia sagamensis]SMP31762.1 YARHG domain-containing protein [Shimia sagamensis]